MNVPCQFVILFVSGFADYRSYYFTLSPSDTTSTSPRNFDCSLSSIEHAYCSTYQSTQFPFPRCRTLQITVSTCLISLRFFFSDRFSNLTLILQVDKLKNTQIFQDENRKITNLSKFKWDPLSPNVIRLSGWWPYTVRPFIDKTLHQFLTVTDMDLITEFEYVPNCARFK